MHKDTPGFSKKSYPKKTRGGGHIDPPSPPIDPGRNRLSLCGNIKVKETTTIMFTNLGQNLKAY